VGLERRLGREVLQPAASSTVLRRFAGLHADELAILCRPEGQSLDPAQQAEAAYRALATLLADHQASFRDLTSETLLLRDIRRELPLVLAIRTRVLADLGQSAAARVHPAGADRPGRELRALGVGRGPSPSRRMVGARRPGRAVVCV
jgi:hypothetical protein